MPLANGVPHTFEAPHVGMLLSVLKERREGEVREIWADLVSRGRGWTARARQGLAALDKAFPELGARKWLKL